MRQDQLRQTIIDLTPHFRARDGRERVARNFDGEIHGTPMPHVNDVCGRAEHATHFLDGLYCCGKSDALQPAAGECIQTRERERQMRAALIIGDGVNFIHDNRRGGRQHFPRLLRSQEDEQRFRRSD